MKSVPKDRNHISIDTNIVVVQICEVEPALVLFSVGILCDDGCQKR